MLMPRFVNISSKSKYAKYPRNLRDLYINNGHPSPVANEIIADMLITAINFKY